MGAHTPQEQTCIVIICGGSAGVFSARSLIAKHGGQELLNVMPS